jgi:rod shape-determining protein MreC
VAKPRRSRRTLTTLVVLVLISVTVITLDGSGRAHGLISGVRSIASDVFSPVRSGVDDVIDPVGDFFAGALNYGALQEENHRLEAENGALRQRAVEKSFQERQLQQLTALENLPFLDQLPTVTAEVQSIDDSNFAATVDIDKGRDEGVALGDPVVGSGGLVGQVVEADHGTSIVRLVTDGQSRVGVTFGNGQFATVAGIGPRREMTADFIATGVPVTIGEPMYTNGLSGAAYPAGIPVASVTSIRTVPGADQQTVTVRPSADLDSLAYVDVVQWSPSP